MDNGILQRFRENLERQRQGLLEWLRGTPAEKRQVHLGPSSEGAVQTRLEKLSDALSKADQHTFGLCDVCHEYIEAGRLEMDFTASVCLDHYSEEQKRQLEQELELSVKVQKALLPKEPPRIPGMTVAAFSQPATVVGGDYFDFFRFRDGGYGIALADVMGKGLPASMLVASLQASLRIIVPESDSPAQVMKRLNTLFYHNIHLIKFISLFLARYDPQTRLLEYCNAGHNPPILIHTSNGRPSLRRLRPTGAAIGLTESLVFDESRISLEKGDFLLLYTDGATEAASPNAEEFGEERLEEWFISHHQLQPNAVIEELRRALGSFIERNTFRDDLTLIAAKVG